MDKNLSGCCTSCHTQSKVAVLSYIKNLTCTTCGNRTLVGWRVYEWMFPLNKIEWKTHKPLVVEGAEPRARRIIPTRKLIQIVTGEYGEV